MSLRSQAISLYRRILRAGTTWEGPLQEREYIREEARSLFRRNMALQDPRQIQEKVFEAESRLELALHYHNPYPRMY